MKISNEFRVAASLEQAWELLTDIEAIAPCLPGARLTGSDGDAYKGTMKVKVGPITAEYSGTATITELDETGRRVLLSASGRDSRGAGNASAEIEATMVEDSSGSGHGTVVSIDTELRVAGKVAQFGRGVMADVSTKLIGQFAECIEAKLADAAAAKAPSGDTAVPSGVPAEEVSDIPPSQDESTTGTDRADTRGDLGSEGTASAADPDDNNDALDLLDVAGAALAKRLVPVALVVIVVVVLLALLL